MYPPLSEVGFRLRSESGAELPALIEATRRTEAGQSQDYLLPAPVRGSRAAAGEGAAPSPERVSKVSP
jgi:hypothetical protein